MFPESFHLEPLRKVKISPATKERLILGGAVTTAIILLVIFIRGIMYFLGSDAATWTGV